MNNYGIEKKRVEGFHMVFIAVSQIRVFRVCDPTLQTVADIPSGYLT